MNIYEYQAKELLEKNRIPIPKGFVINDVSQINKAVWRIETSRAVVKAQILAGGRGKAGGVRIADSITSVEKIASEMLGKTLITEQTDQNGETVNALYIEEACEIWKEYYLAVVLDREIAKITIVASEEGGVDIEQVASKTPDKIIKEVIEPCIGLQYYNVRNICSKLGINDESIEEFSNIIYRLYQVFIKYECLMLEINPLVITKSKKVIALDAKISFDENALYRQNDILKFKDNSTKNELEILAEKKNLSYVPLDGEIGCLVNGAGLAMATMDLISHYGGTPANFLDIGGGASEEKVKAALEIIQFDTNIKCILVNIFGGISKGDEVARGIVSAMKTNSKDIPMIVRLEGTNAKEGISILLNDIKNIVVANSLDDATLKAVNIVLERN